MCVDKSVQLNLRINAIPTKLVTVEHAPIIAELASVWETRIETSRKNRMVPIHFPSAVLFIVFYVRTKWFRLVVISSLQYLLYGWDREDTSLILSVGRKDSDTIDDGTVPFIVHFLRNWPEAKKPGLRCGWRCVARVPDGWNLKVLWDQIFTSRRIWVFFVVVLYHRKIIARACEEFSLCFKKRLHSILCVHSMSVHPRMIRCPEVFEGQPFLM